MIELIVCSLLLNLHQFQTQNGFNFCLQNYIKILILDMYCNLQIFIYKIEA